MSKVAIDTKKKEKKRKERKKEEKRDFSTKVIDLKEKKKKKEERDRGLDRDTKRNGEDVETLLWASFGDRGSEVEQGNRESYDCHGINKCGEVAALHGWTSEPETLPSYRFLLSFVSLASCLSRHRAEGSWLHNFALLLLDLAFFHSSIGPAFHSPSPPFFFSMHNLSLSLFFLPSRSRPRRQSLCAFSFLLSLCTMWSNYIGELLYSRGTLVTPLHFFAGVIPPLEKMPGRNLFHLYFHLRYELTTWIRAVASWRLVFVRRSGFCPEFLPSRDLPLQFSFFSFSPRIVVRLVPAKNTPDF